MFGSNGGVFNQTGNSQAFGNPTGGASRTLGQGNYNQFDMSRK